MRELVFSAHARRNLRSIFLYSLKHWGEAQADAYQMALARAFTALTDNPALGGVREDVRSDWRVLNVERHRIVYRFTDQEVIILQILHARMDIGSRTKN